MYGGASFGMEEGKIAILPSETPLSARLKRRPSEGLDLQGKRLPQKFGHVNVTPFLVAPSSFARSTNEYSIVTSSGLCAARPTSRRPSRTAKLRGPWSFPTLSIESPSTSNEAPVRSEAATLIVAFA